MKKQKELIKNGNMDDSDKVDVVGQNLSKNTEDLIESD